MSSELTDLISIIMSGTLTFFMLRRLWSRRRQVLSVTVQDLVRRSLAQQYLGILDRFHHAPLRGLAPFVPSNRPSMCLPGSVRSSNPTITTTQRRRSSLPPPQLRYPVTTGGGWLPVSNIDRDARTGDMTGAVNWTLLVDEEGEAGLTDSLLLRPQRSTEPGLLACPSPPCNSFAGDPEPAQWVRGLQRTWGPLCTASSHTGSPRLQHASVCEPERHRAGGPLGCLGR